MNGYASFRECEGCGRSGEQIWVQVQPENSPESGLCQYCRNPHIQAPPFEYMLRMRPPPILDLSGNPARKREKELRGRIRG